MSSADIARLIMEGMKPPEGNNDLGFAQGQIIAWDELSGTNTVRIWNQDYNNLSALQSGIGVLFQPGDKVGLLRFQTTYFVLGKIAAPGAGAASQIRSATNNFQVNQPLQAFGDLTGSFGPELTNVYIGSSRRCLVLVTAQIAANSTAGAMGFQVSGASSIVASADQAAYVSGPSNTLSTIAGSTAQILLTSANGLNQGFNTFTAKYRIVDAGLGTGTGAIFRSRVITVIPF